MIKKERKPKTKRIYFGPEVDLAIVRYNATDDSAVKSLIYNNEIRTAFEKLVENIVHTFKFYYTGDQSLIHAQHEVTSFLVEKLPKFKSSQGKAFSYFSIVAKNYCILRNKSNYKKLITHESLNATSEIEIEYVLDDKSVEEDKTAFISIYIAYWDKYLDTIFPKKMDRIIAASIIELFRKKDKIELFNKKALYIYIREMSDGNTQQITRMVKTMKDKYNRMYADYMDLGWIPKNKIY